MCIFLKLKPGGNSTKCFALRWGHKYFLFEILLQQQENYNTKISKISHMQNTVGYQQELVVILARSNITYRYKRFEVICLRLKFCDIKSCRFFLHVQGSFFLCFIINKCFSRSSVVFFLDPLICVKCYALLDSFGYIATNVIHFVCL